jgi:ABC-2 type transport system permease protein
MKKIWVQSRKELAQFQRDRLTLALAFLLPFISLLIFGFAVRLESKNIPIYIQDFSLTTLSRSYVERLLATNQFKKIPEQYLIKAPIKNPEILLDRGLAKVVVIIPPDFSRDIKSGSSSTVQILIDGSDVNNARVIKNSIQATTLSFLKLQNLTSISDTLAPQIRLWFNPGRREYLYIVPGLYGLILWIFPSLLTAIAMVREKTQGTIIQVYSSAMNPAELILGKSLAYLLVGIAEAIFIMGCGSAIWGLRVIISPITLYLGTLILLLDSTLYGIFLGLRAPNQTAAIEAVALTGFLTALLLSGFIYPLSNIPFPLSLLSYIVPARYYIDISRDAYVRGTGWTGVWLSFVVLILLGLIIFGGCYQSLKKMQLSD